MGGKKKSTVGFRYYTGSHMIFGLGPWDAVHKIKYGDKAAWTGPSSGGAITVNNPALYGGDDGEGGIAGAVDIMMGLPTQGRNAYLLSKQGPTASAVRDVVSLVFQDMYWGNANYYKTVSLIGTRILLGDDGAAQWYPGKASIARPDASGPDMNAIHIIREALTRIKKVPASMIDDTVFTGAADTCYAEGFGLSVEWKGETSADDFIQNILDIIDARMYIHPRTKLYTIKLIRKDYDPDSLPVLGRKQIKKIDNWLTPEPDELPNSIAVTYWSGVDESDDTVQVSDPAAIIAAGRPISISRKYTDAVTDWALAAEIAKRDLIAAGAPITSCTLTCTPAAADLLPGDAFVLDWPDLSDTQRVMRVATTKRGGLLNRRVVIECVESVFELTETTVGAVAPGWTDPRDEALPQAVAFAVEAPYYELLQRLGDTQLSGLLAATPDAGLLLGTARRVDNAINAIGYSDGAEWAARPDLSPTGVLQAAIGQTETALDINWTSAPAVGSHIQIDGELMRFDGFNVSARSVVGRGVLDTTPAAHALGATSWAWDLYAASDEIERAAGETVTYTVKLRNNSKEGALSLAKSVTFAERAIRPYPPARFRIGGVSYPASGARDLVLTWAARNRQTQADQIIDESAATITAEAGTTYNVSVVRTDTSASLYSQTGLTVLTHTVPTLSYEGQIRVSVSSVRDGHTCWQPASCVLDYLRTEARLTEDGEERLTESGELRITED